MSRFRVIKSKGRYYVVTTDSNGLAGGPYEAEGDAAGRRDELIALEAKQAEAARQPHGKINITPGYRSPDVEDGRFDPRPDAMAPYLMPPGWVKWNTPNRQPLPPGWVPPWKNHRIPSEIDPEAAAMIAEPIAPTVADAEPPPLPRVASRAVPPWALPARTLKP